MADTTVKVNNMFSGLKTPKDLTKFTLYRGVTDYANVSQFNPYETGYSYLIPVAIPKMLEKLRDESEEYRKLIDNYLHILEYEFKGLEGLDDMTAETSEINNGISTLRVITKTQLQSGDTTISLRFTEKTGTPITKVHKLYLDGIKNPRTQVKTYNGLIAKGILEPGFENEVFAFLYFVCDNTMRNIEKAVYFVAAQPTKSELSIYNVQRGEIEFKEVGVEFSAFPIMGKVINEKAVEILKYINENTQYDHNEYNYSTVADMGVYQKKTANSDNTLTIGGTGINSSNNASSR